MPVDPSRLLGAELPPRTWTWDERDVLLYHLALGAGADPAHPHELTYTYERDLRVLPTYGAVTTVPVLMSFFDLPGIDFDPDHVLHGAHELRVLRPMPVAATVAHAGRVEALHDQGKHALAVVRVDTRDEASGEPLFVNRFTLFLAGQGGFGGERAPAPGGTPPDRAPDATRSVALAENQALLFRLTGDRHPIHVDPEVAAARGFGRPILHGLCTFGMAARFAVDAFADGDVRRLTSVRGRFAQAVLPGETLDLQGWRDGTDVVLGVRASERELDVLSAASARFDESAEELRA